MAANASLGSDAPTTVELERDNGGVQYCCGRQWLRLRFYQCPATFGYLHGPFQIRAAWIKFDPFSAQELFHFHLFLLGVA